MKRRSFIRGAATGATAAAAATIAAPAIAQGLPEIRWRLASSFPKSLDTLFGSAEYMAKRVSDATGGRFQIRVFAGGEIVPAFSVADAVQNNTVEMAQTAAYYFVGKDPTFAFDCAMPFGLNTRQQNAWMQVGGGRDLMSAFYKDYNIHAMPSGNTGAQMGGWFRNEIKTPADLKGLKMRIAGLAGQVLAKLGAVPQQLPGGDIYPALEKGTIDATEWVGPYDDEKLGFQKVAKFYYYPAFWEGGTQISTYVNLTQWQALPAEYRAILEAACADTHNWTIAKYDNANLGALRRLLASGAQLRPFSREILDACLTATNELYEETVAKNPKFKAVYEPWRRFRDDQLQWFQVTESSFDNYMIQNRARMAPRPG